MGTPELPEIERRLQAHAPATLLAIGRQAGALAAEYRAARPKCAMECLDPHGTLAPKALLDELGQRQRYDFAIVRGVLERFDSESGANLIARLRDLHARRFCVVLNMDEPRPKGTSPWTAPDLIAVGLSHWSTSAVGSATLQVYGYDVGSYKTTPDWLNARHWAHPERWGKDRW